MITALLLTAWTAMGQPGDSGVHIADLSSVLRLDLAARQSSVLPGEAITLVATLTNLTDSPVVISPGDLVARPSWAFNPRCADDLGSSGGSISEGVVGRIEQQLEVLNARDKVQRTWQLPQPSASGCEAGGSFVLEIEYCCFMPASLRGMQALNGCVGSNSTVVLLERESSVRR